MTGPDRTPDPNNDPDRDPDRGPVIGRRAARRRSRARRPGWLVAVAAVAALLPVLAMTVRVHRAPQMPYSDYWSSLGRTVNPDGSVYWRGLLSYQNEHPFVVPNALYLANAQWLDGTNHAMGYYSVLVAALTVVLLGRLLPRTWSPAARAALLVLIAFLVFCPTGLWNFVRGMSGVAWLTANLLAVLAVTVVVRRPGVVGSVLATVLAGIATVTYGTGLAAPLALVAALLLLGRRRLWALPAGLFVVAAIVFKATVGGISPTTGTSHDPSLIGSTFLSNLGILWDGSGGQVGRLFGALGLGLLVAAAARCRSERAVRTELAAWWALAVYSVLASGLISLARSETFAGDGAQGRYVSLSALFWIAVTVLTLRTVVATWSVPARVVAAGVLVVTAWTSGSGLIDDAVSLDGDQRLLAAAARVGTAGPFAQQMPSADLIVPRLRVLGDYPFDDGYELGCGHRPGDVLAATPPPAALTAPDSAGTVQSVRSSEGAQLVTGWVHRAGAPVTCVLLIDTGNRVVGGGVAGFARADVQRLHPGFPVDTGFKAVAPAAAGQVQVVLGFRDGLFRLIRLAG